MSHVNNKSQLTMEVIDFYVIKMFIYNHDYKLTRNVHLLSFHSLHIIYL